MGNQESHKILIIRFSSFGDIIQCLSVVSPLREKFAGAEIHWAVRSDLAELPALHPAVSRVWALDRKEGLAGLWRFSRALAAEGFTEVYDAHNNLRAHFLTLIMRLFSAQRFSFTRRAKARVKRFLLFKLRLNLLKEDAVGVRTYQRPLALWGVRGLLSKKVDWQLDPAMRARVQEMVGKKFGPAPWTLLAPSAAWPMKRWPIAHWKRLIELCPERKFAVIGGPQDDFCAELEDVAPERVLNLAGKLSLLESCALVSEASQVVVADTGILHVADLFGVPTFALIGPTAFGFPASPSSKVFEIPLSCRPCTKDGRGRCVQSVWQKCLVDIRPEQVAAEIEQAGAIN